MKWMERLEEMLRITDGVSFSVAVAPRDLKAALRYIRELEHGQTVFHSANLVDHLVYQDEQCIGAVFEHDGKWYNSRTADSFEFPNLAQNDLVNRNMQDQNDLYFERLKADVVGVLTDVARGRHVPHEKALDLLEKLK